MDPGFFVKGAVIGLAIAAPVGPIGVLCIRNTLARGRPAGLATGMGAATADALYGAVAAFGLTVVSQFLLEHRGWIQLAGGAFLCALGVRTALARVGDGAGPAPGGGLARNYAASVLLTLANPATILSFAAVFAGAGLGQSATGRGEALALVAGVFFGSAAWWLALSTLVQGWRQRSAVARQLGANPLSGAALTGFGLGYSAVQLRWVNRASGAVLGGFGLFAIGLSLA